MREYSASNDICDRSLTVIVSTEDESRLPKLYSPVKKDIVVSTIAFTPWGIYSKSHIIWEYRRRRRSPVLRRERNVNRATPTLRDMFRHFT